MTPEQIQAMQQEQMSAQMAPEQDIMEQQMQMDAQPQMQMGTQPQMQPQMPQPSEEQVLEEAKKQLGLDNIEAKLKQLEQEKLKAELKSEYKEVPQEAIDKALEEIKEKDPVLYEATINSKEGLKLLYERAKANIEPKEKPDDITDSSDQQSPADDALEKIKKGDLSGDKFFMTLGTLMTGE